MPYTTTTYDDGRIIHMVMDTEFDFLNDFNQFATEAADYMDTVSQPIVIITDSRGRPIHNLNDLMQGGGITLRPEGKRMLKHPNLLKIYDVTASKAVQLTLKGLNSATFGYVEVPVFDTLEEALNAARAALYGQSKTGSDVA